MSDGRYIMNKSLKTIQTQSKIGRVLSEIVFICSLVSAGLCLAGMTALALGVEDAFRIGGVTVHSIIANEINMTTDQMLSALVVSLIFSAGEAVLSKFAEVYFKHELAAQTPFTFDGAKEMLRLGILAVAIPIGTQLIAAVVNGILSEILSGTWNTEVRSGDSVAIGIMFMVSSVIFKYGAELKGEKENA